MLSPITFSEVGARLQFINNSVFALAVGMSVLFYISSAPEPYDPGGNVMERYRMVQAANRNKLHAVITGTCVSACTMTLGIENVCIDPNATLLFHQASHHGTIVKSEYDTNILMRTYPRAIQNWVRGNGALNKHELTKMTGREAIEMGIASCWQ